MHARVSFPIDGMKFVFRTLAKAAEEQWSDDAPLKEGLMELQVKVENAEVTEDEYIQHQAAILTELREIGRRKRAPAPGPNQPREANRRRHQSRVARSR